jgi:hypothetical protein
MSRLAAGTGGQGFGGGVGGQGAAEQQQHAAQEGGQQYRAADMTPVVPGARAQVLGGLPPRRAQSFQGRQDDQHHQRDLEVQVDDDHAGQRVQGEAVCVRIEAEGGEPLADQPAGADGRDEQESQRHAAEVGEHARRRDRHLPQQSAALGGEDRVGDDQAQDPRYDRGEHRQDDALPETLQVDAVGGGVDVAEREAAVVVLEGADRDGHHRRDQE